MKKGLALLFVLILMGTAFGGCHPENTSESHPQSTEDSGSDNGMRPVDPPSGLNDFDTDIVYNWNQDVIVNTRECRVIFEEAHADVISGFVLRITCENKNSNTKLLFSFDAMAINGLMFEPIWSDTVDAGQRHSSEMIIRLAELNSCGIKAVDEFKFLLRISDYDDWTREPLFSEMFTLYPTGKDAASVLRPDRPPTENEKQFSDDPSLRFYVLGKTNSLVGIGINLYAENLSDEDLYLSWSDVKLNGSDNDPYWKCRVLPGCGVMSVVTFFTGDDSVLSSLSFQLNATHDASPMATPFYTKDCTYQ